MHHRRSIYLRLCRYAESFAISDAIAEPVTDSITNPIAISSPHGISIQPTNRRSVIRSILEPNVIRPIAKSKQNTILDSHARSEHQSDSRSDHRSDLDSNVDTVFGSYD